MLVGLFVLALCTYLVAFRRSSSNTLILVGIFLLFFNVFLNVFSLTDSWNPDMARLQSIYVYRHIIVGFFGCVLVLCGMISSALNNSKFAARSPFLVGAGACIFAIWFWGSGWLKFAITASREPKSPSMNWQTMASAIDAGFSPLCVPINPWLKGANWMYHRNCDLLKTPPAWEDGSVLVKDNVGYQISPPRVLLDKHLVAAAVLFKPLQHGRSFVKVMMRITLKDGNTRYFAGSHYFNASGGLLMLVGAKPVSINEVAGITLTFNVPVKVALASQEPAGIPGVAWMGY
jgi:hypothetical protein